MGVCPDWADREMPTKGLECAHKQYQGGPREGGRPASQGRGEGGFLLLRQQQMAGRRAAFFVQREMRPRSCPEAARTW